jgi:hypothetical protein
MGQFLWNYPWQPRIHFVLVLEHPELRIGNNKQITIFKFG